MEYVILLVIALIIIGYYKFKSHGSGSRQIYNLVMAQVEASG